MKLLEKNIGKIFFGINLTNFWSSQCCSVGMNPNSIHEDMGLLPDPTQWVKDLALLWAVVLVADMAQILFCCSCGVGGSYSSDLTPSPGTSICHRCGLRKTKKKKFILSVSQGNIKNNKNKQIGPNQTYKLLHRKGNHKKK